MSTQPPKSFAEQARELQAQKEAQQANEQAKQAEVNNRQQRIANESPSIAQQYAAEVVQQVKLQVQEVGQAYKIPTSAQLGTALEVVVNDRWLLTGNPQGNGITIATHDLRAMNNPRFRNTESMLGYEEYQIDLDTAGNWGWHLNRDSATRRSTFYPGMHKPATLTNQELIDLILGKALDLARKNMDEETTQYGGGFRAF